MKGAHSHAALAYAIQLTLPLCKLPNIFIKWQVYLREFCDEWTSNSLICSASAALLSLRQYISHALIYKQSKSIFYHATYLWINVSFIAYRVVRRSPGVFFPLIFLFISKNGLMFTADGVTKDWSHSKSSLKYCVWSTSNRQFIPSKLKL